MKLASEHVLILGAAAIAVAGLLLELRVGNDLFARSGAVLVAYGVIMVSRAVYAAERRSIRHEARFEKLEAAYLDASTNGTDKPVSPETFGRLATAYSEFREARLAREGRLLATEVGIVCVGTLIWGFGDLVV